MENFSLQLNSLKLFASLFPVTEKSRYAEDGNLYERDVGAVGGESQRRVSHCAE